MRFNKFTDSSSVYRGANKKYRGVLCGNSGMQLLFAPPQRRRILLKRNFN